MKCSICCQGETAPGFVTVTLTRDETTVIVKEVPADVCNNCGEYYLSEPVTAEVLALAERAVAERAEVEIVRYAA